MQLSNNQEIRPEKLHRLAMKLREEDLKVFNKDEFVSVSCPACESKKSNFLFTKQKFDFVECKKCNTVYINPRPTQKLLEIFYTSSKSISQWNKIYKKTASIRKERIFKPRMKIVKKILKKYKMEKCKNLTEVGAGYGWFCQLAKQEKLAKEIIAIEPSPLFAKVCRKIDGIKVIQSTIEKQRNLDADVIVNFELIEHLFKPRSFLESCYNGLRKGGVLIFSTPNYYGLDIQILKEKSDNVNGPNHLNYFNPHSIVLLLKSIGFRNIEVMTPGVLDTSIIINKIKSGELDVEKYPFFGFLIKYANESFLKEFQLLIQRNKMSSNMIISAQK